MGIDWKKKLFLTSSFLEVHSFSIFRYKMQLKNVFISWESGLDKEIEMKMKIPIPIPFPFPIKQYPMSVDK